MSDPRQPSGGDRVQERIRAFILEQFPVARRKAPGDDDPLLESGIVDSLGILEIVNFMSAEFDVTVSDEDLQPEHFNSIRSLAEFVAGKRDA